VALDGTFICDGGCIVLAIVCAVVGAVHGGAVDLVDDWQHDDAGRTHQNNRRRLSMQQWWKPRCADYVAGYDGGLTIDSTTTQAASMMEAIDGWKQK